MLLPKRRIKQKIIRSLAASIFLSLVLFGGYLFFSLSRPLFVSPLAKNINSQNKTLEDLLTSAHVPFASVSKTNDSMYKIILSNGMMVFLDPKKDLNSEVSSLQAILKQLTIEGKEAKSIDFRFDKPVIAFE